jgi:hypothetical protein
MQFIPWEVLGSRTRKNFPLVIVTGSMAGALKTIITFFNNATQVGTDG